MTENRRYSDRKPNPILRWLGVASPEHMDDSGAHANPRAEGEVIHDARERRRRQMLEDVSSFLVTHRLEVSPFTLAVAHDVITGCDIQLARTIEERVAAREPVTLEWLEQAGRNLGRDDGTAALRALMTKLDESIDEFARTASDARHATQDYSTSLQSHVTELEQVSKAGIVITELAAIARVMLDRTREIEEQMSDSEKQTKLLQKKLEEARRTAETDHLTGLPNRRAFESFFDSTVAEATRAGESLCVAFCDIDHFKKINDTHGHEAGDRVLKAVAQTLAKISNDHCHVARHGGEEFVILLRGKSIAEALAVLEGAREAMAERRLVNRATDVPFGRITFSGGLAEVFSCSSPREALRLADEALYAAKARGRNCIEIISEQPAVDSRAA